jgi:hypothetical protein
MSTTSAYGWNIPDNTDLVKDGALAIRTLGNAIDTSMNTALGTKKAGMVLLNTTSFSAVASQSINSVFSSTYTNYKILIPASAAGENLNFRMRVSGADETGSIYSYTNAFITSDTGTQAADRAELGSLITFGEFGNGLVSIEIANPFASSYTALNWVNTIGRTSGAGRNRTKQGTAIVGNTTSYTGYTIYVSTGSITGSVSTYGYNV